MQARQRWTGAALATLAVLGAAPAAWPGAPTPQQTVDASPTTVRGGDVLTVTGTGCLDPDTASADGLRVYIGAEGLGYPGVDNPTGLMGGSVAPAADGTFERSFTIDRREQYFGPYEDSVHQLVVTCRRDADRSTIGSYPTIAITYDGRADDPAPTSSPPPTDPPSPAATEAPAAVAAAPQRGLPTVTG